MSSSTLSLYSLHTILKVNWVSLFGILFYSFFFITHYYSFLHCTVCCCQYGYSHHRTAIPFDVSHQLYSLLPYFVYVTLLNFTLLYYTIVRYCTRYYFVLHYTVLYYNTLYSTILYLILLRSPMLYSLLLFWILRLLLYLVLIWYLVLKSLSLHAHILLFHLINKCLSSNLIEFTRTFKSFKKVVIYEKPDIWRTYFYLILSTVSRHASLCGTITFFLILFHLILFHLIIISPYLILPYFTLPYFTLINFTSSYSILSYLISSYPILSYLILSHLILSYLILSHLTHPTLQHLRTQGRVLGTIVDSISRPSLAS